MKGLPPEMQTVVKKTKDPWRMKHAEAIATAYEQQQHLLKVSAESSEILIPGKRRHASSAMVRPTTLDVQATVQTVIIATSKESQQPPSILGDKVPAMPPPPGFEGK